MTAIDGQMDIFGDVFDEPRPADTSPWECPHCGYEWTRPNDRDALIDWHTSHWTIKQGGCQTQDLYLDWLNARRDARRQKSVKWGAESDLLGLILQAKARGCTEKEIRKALAVEWEAPRSRWQK